jgi:FxsC-like protein
VAAHFFMSYSRADEDGYLKQFFDDLVREVRGQSGAAIEDVGFRDSSNMSVGAPWRHELTTAVSTARTFLALYSASYFASEFCGREWAAFASRMEGYHRRNGTRPPALLPVLWVPVRSLPEPAQLIQYTHEDLGETYAQEGLYHLLRLRKYRDDYHEFLRRLGRQIVTVADRFRLQPLDPSFDLLTMPSAFHPRSRTDHLVIDLPETGPTVPRQGPPGQEHRPRPRAPRSGPRHVHFVMMAACSRDMVRVRDDLQHYGPEPFDWSPYRPELDQRISVFAQNVAANQDLSSGLTEAHDILELLDRASRRNELVVLLVDAWATKLDDYRDYMIAYDRRNEPASAVMVPWSTHDHETLLNAEELHRCLELAFPKNVIRGDDLFRIRIESPERFRAELVEILVKAQGRVFRSGTVGRRAGGDFMIERPLLELPDQEVGP